MGCGLDKNHHDDSDQEEIYRKKEPSEQDKIEKNESEKDQIKNKDKKKNKSKKAKKSKKLKNSEGSEEAKDSKGTNKPKSTYPDNPDLPYNQGEKAREPKRVIPSVQTRQKENVSNMQNDNLKKKTEPKGKQPATRTTSVTKVETDDVRLITQQPTSVNQKSNDYFKSQTLGGTPTVTEIPKAEFKVSPTDKFKRSHERTNIDEETKPVNQKSNDYFKSQTLGGTPTVTEIPKAEFKVSPTDKFKCSHERTNIDEETKPQRNNKVQNDDSKQNKKPESTRNTSARVEGVITQQPTSAKMKSNDYSSKSQKTVQDNSKVNETRIAESKALPPEKTTKSDSQHQNPGIINVSPLNDAIELKPNVGIETKNEQTIGVSEFARSANRMKIESKNTYNIEEEEKRLVQSVLKRKISQVSSEKIHKRIEKEITIASHSMDKDGISKVSIDKGDSNVSHLIHATRVDDQKMIEDTELNRQQENNVNLDQGSPGQDTDFHSLPVADQSQERVESLPVTDQSQERVESLPVADQSQERVESLPVAHQSQERVESLPVTDQSQERVESLPVADQSQERVELLPVTDQSQERVESLPVTHQSQERVESLPVTDQSQERVESLPVADQSQERVESKEVEPMEVDVNHHEEFQDCSEENMDGSSSYASLDEDNSIKYMLYSTNEIQSSSSEFQECSNVPNHEISSSYLSQQIEENSTNHSESNKHSTEFKSSLYNRVVKNDDASCPINDANDLSHSSVEQMGKRKRENEELFDARDPEGLRNLGNTCFFNSVMQNLLQTHALEDALRKKDSPPVSQQPKNKRSKNSEVHASSSKPLTAALIDFYRRPSPENVFGQICNKSPRFRGGHQQDSHELLRHLMDGLRNEEKEMSSGENPQKILTLVDKVFGGHYMTVYTCHVCTLPYHLCEPMLDISLPVTFSRDTFSNNKYQQFPENKVDPELEEREKEGYKEAIKAMMSRCETLDHHINAGSVEDCLRFFTREELLDEYLCMACYNKRQNRGETELVMTEATKQTLVYNPPAILTLHLKRFEQTARGFKKANNPISFEEILDLGPFCSSWSKRVQPNQKNIWYSLYGVVVHGGSLSGGHYVAYVKARNCDIASLRGFQQKKFLDRDGITEETLVEEMRKWSQSRHQSKYQSGYKPSEGEWYYVSDSYVDKSSWGDVRKQQAYLLFYERLKNTKETKRINNPEEGTHL